MAKQNRKSEMGNRKSGRLVPLLLGWFAREARDLPWRRTRDPYAIWVSEIMLQQTQVKTVIPYWERWMRELPTIESVAKANPDKIHKLWEGLGYYTRVRNLQKAAQQIIAQQNPKSRSSRGNEALTKIGNRQSAISNQSESSDVGCCQFPDEFDDVLALPGIGRYTAGAICSIAFNQPTPILDGNVIRVLTRVFGIAEDPKEKGANARLWTLAEKLVSHAKTATAFSPSRPSRPLCEDDRCSHLNQSLMELGALICTPRNPQCLLCPVQKHCVALKEHRIEDLPNLGKRIEATARHFVAFVIERDGKFLVRHRPAGVVNAHLWEFPNIETGARISPLPHTPSAMNGHKSLPLNGARARGRMEDARFMEASEFMLQLLGLGDADFRHLCTVKHSITRYRITLDAFKVDLGRARDTSPRLKNGKSSARITRPAKGLLGKGVWLPASKFGSLAFTAAHKKLASFAAKGILSGP